MGKIKINTTNKNKNIELPDMELIDILVEVVDKYFPKGDKRRGEALVVMAKSFRIGVQQKYGLKKDN